MSDTRHRIIVAAAISVLALAGIFYSCGGGSGGDVVMPGTGTVALFLTDSIAEYQQVTATINTVQLIHTGSGAATRSLPVP
jgi:hypothetical protein